METHRPPGTSRRALFQGLGAGIGAGLAASVPPALARPLPSELFLQAFDVAGIPYHQARAVADTLRKGEVLVLRREPQNPHDPLAIAIHTGRSDKLGYVPRVHNAPYARLLDAGWDLRCAVAEVRAHGTWLDIEVEVTLIAT